MKNINEMQIVSKGNLKESELFSSILKKKVISANGEILGKVKDVAFDLNSVKGIYVSSGFFGVNMLIDKDYIQKLNADSVILKIDPVPAITGKVVFDSDGKKIGKVQSIIRNDNTNDFTEAVVRKSRIRKAIKIPKKDMGVISKNIILNRAYD